MEQNRDTLNALIKYLVEHGYPSSSIAIEYPAGRRRTDLAVVDPDTKEVVAVFELKNRRNPQSEKFGKKQLRTYLKALGNPAVPAYLVFDNPDLTPPFEIDRVREEPDETGELVDSNLPDFLVLQESRKSTAPAEKKAQKEAALDRFLIACWGSAALTTLLLFVDLVSGFTMSKQQFVLFGVIIALIIIPFAKKLKIQGIEFERYERQTKEADKE